jgi:ATP-dependent DNA helicase RecG
MLNEYAVCFANQNGGTLVLGVDDKVKGREKAITGCSGYNVHEMKSRIYEATDPKILVDIEELRIEDIGVTILLVHIAKGIGIHTTTDGTAKIRIGRECKPMTGSMRHQRSVELGLIDFTAEAAKNLTPHDLSKIEMERLRNIIRAKKPESALLKLRDEEFLKQLGLIRNNNPTIAGILLIGKEDVIEKYVPSHEVTYLHMKSDIKYDKRSDYKNGLLSILEDVYQNVELYNKVTTVKIGLFHFEIKDFPEDTYREVILNAVLHRDYSETAAIFIRHFKDRLEISNPDFSLN